MTRFLFNKAVPPGIVLLALLCGCRTQLPMAYPYSGDLRAIATRATASSSQAGHSPRQAFDGRSGSRWSSEFRDEQWLQLELKAVCEIAEIRLEWEEAFATHYRVSTSLTGRSWEELITVTDGQGDLEVVEAVQPIHARFIRIDCLLRGTPYGNSLWEMTVLGRSPIPVPLTGGLLGADESSDDPRHGDTIQTRHAELMAKAEADPPSAMLTDKAMLRVIQRRTFQFFWEEMDETTGLIPDRILSFRPMYKKAGASIANAGFFLSAVPIAIEQGWITRPEGETRVRNLLLTARDRIDASHGFYWHFIDMKTLQRDGDCELSSIDTGLFLMGVLAAEQYFAGSEIAELCQELHERVDWPWMMAGDSHISMGWKPESGHLSARWGGMSEGMMLYVLATGSATHPISPDSWASLNRPTGEYGGHSFLIEPGFQSLFRYQYPFLWLDWREWSDGRADYQASAVQAVYACRQYCLDLAGRLPGFGENRWGLSPADDLRGRYQIYGFPPGTPYSRADGTIVPYATIGSVFLAPEICLPAIRELYTNQRYAWGKYGFADSIRPDLQQHAPTVLGIDQGTIILGIENYLSGLPRQLVMSHPVILRAMQRMGFTPNSR